uniref:RING-type domain-containing protein n=1 Tax=Oryza punctata TaxID=4537 RepID=A0A0E0MIW2_ORYPU
MDAEDFVDWLLWATIFLCFLACIAVAVCLLAVTIAEVVRLIRRRNDDGNNMLIERLLLRPKEDEEDCVICLQSEKEEDERVMLPGCAHAFHKDCVVKWLRNHTTCPLCRSHVFVAAAAADDMV